MFSSTRCSLTMLRSHLAAASMKLDLSQPCLRINSLPAGQPVLQSRQKHEGFFDNLFEAPVDKGKIIIDEVLKGFGDRGIRRDGGRVAYQDMFKLFQLEDKFLISESKLHREMIKLQRALHPDKFLRADRTSQLASDQLSSLVNEAYETLRHPYKRALYYMRLKANKSESQIEKSLDDMKMEPDFLSRMMELREQIEQGQSMEKQRKLACELQEELDRIVLQVNRDFEIADYDSALKKLGKLKFLANCHIALVDRMAKFDNF